MVVMPVFQVKAESSILFINFAQCSGWQKEAAVHNIQIPKIKIDFIKNLFNSCLPLYRIGVALIIPAVQGGYLLKEMNCRITVGV